MKFYIRPDQRKHMDAILGDAARRFDEARGPDLHKFAACAFAARPMVLRFARARPATISAKTSGHSRSREPASTRSKSTSQKATMTTKLSSTICANTKLCPQKCCSSATDVWPAG